ncbi:MAG: ribosome assembly RNA-binding protein YhbY [Desulfobulbaceae bacterium]|nr:ribosome assembly RNA-binding protein YhbY [Desulfobulbaceae bacterium]HIJ91684.1 ribosome assembly RNA-binding protein YhbY [Deltaproteobacteria bacterium]
MSKTLYLTGKQGRHLRGLGHHLSPLIMIGKDGVTDNLIAALEAVLAAHELVKVKIQDGCPYGREEAAELLAKQTRSRIAQIIGKTFLLFRENKELKEDKKIKIPAGK